MNRSETQSRFQLPDQGVLQANGPDDPLPYYYKPIIGKIYCARIKQALDLLTPPYGAILEMGYGSGILLPSLSKMSESLAGIDLTSSPKQVGRNLSKIGVNCSLIQDDVAGSHFQENSFDLIVAISIFEHISDLKLVINQIYNLLTPQGQLLVGMPRVDPFMEKAFRLIGYKNIDDHHVTGYKECVHIATKQFNLTDSSNIPTWLPDFAGLYFNMLFQKQS